MPRYEEDSIVEALCEFTFAAGTAWDPTVFGAFREAISDQVLPVRETGEVVDFALEPDKGGVRTRRRPRMRFFNNERTRLAQVGENLLVANVLRPYPHWKIFRQFILKTLASYEVAAMPAAIEKLTLRYIDRITITDPDTVFGDWIEKGSAYVPGFLADASHGGFSRVEKPVAGGTEALTLALDRDDQGQRVLTLDTELVSTSVRLDQAAVGQTIDGLHLRIVEIFEACISERTRTLLKPIERTS